MTLRINHLKIAFENKRPVVEDLSLAVEERSFTALVGESGSGKTVTALSVCRLIRPAVLTGEILFSGKNLLSLDEKELLRVRGGGISHIFQDPFSSLNPVLPAGRQIEEAFRIHHPRAPKSEARNEALAALGDAAIPDPERVCRSFPHELSGGLCQRAMIAMALVSRPKVLIADEPTTALDTATQDQIMRLLARLSAERNLAVFFITHDLGLARDWAEVIYVLEKGRLVERLTKEEKFTPREPYTKKLFRAELIDQKPKTFIEI
ncbi:MAG: ABC transporter ATP-binding protein [Candidatus Omnitrophica bacterium]|nr:ABC transporter ATP-binding protein [Candidatus Omnitrophota bacterium]